MAERFSESFLDDLRSAVPITTLIGQYVTWEAGKGREGDKWACCPLHGENSASFHAQDDKGTFHCFGCGESGDHFTFLMKSQGMSFPEAVQTVSELSGIPMPDGMEVSRGPARPPEQPRQEKAAPQPSAASVKSEIVKTYDYTDNDGELVYQVCRLQRKLPDGSWAKNKDGKGTWKSFLQRRPDGAGHWIWGLSAGEFMRWPGRDWRPFKADAFSEGMETRFFEHGVEHTIYRHPEVELAIENGDPVLIVEGEKDAETAVELGFCGTTNSSGSKHWTDKHAANFRDADVVICLDNDAAGDRAEKLAGSLKGLARRIRVLNFAEHVPNFPEKHDLTDWVEAGGAADELQRIIGSLPDWRPSPPKSKLGALSLLQADKMAMQHEWLVDDMIELHGTAAFSGFTQSGKSFQMIELAFAVALGRPFWGRAVKQGLVVYQLGEGQEGFMKRVEGYMKDRGIEDRASIPMLILPKKINLFHSDEDTDALISEAKAWAEYWEMPLRMIVIDTYNKATRGANEISGQDIGRINDRLERIVEQCQCNVTVVDHLSKGGTVRGHGSKTDDVSNMIRVERDETKTDRNGRPIRRMRLDKNKDGENGNEVPFVLRQVVVGHREDGKAITTCVVDPPEGGEQEPGKNAGLQGDQKLVYDALVGALDHHGQSMPAGVEAGPQIKRCVEQKHFVAAVRRRMSYTAPEGEQEARQTELQKFLKRTTTSLMNNGYMGRDNDKKIVWSLGKERQSAAPSSPAPEPPPALPDDVQREMQGAPDEPPF